MRTPERIENEKLADTLATFLREAQDRSQRVIAVLDDIPDEFADVVSSIPARIPMNVFLTRRATVPVAIEGCCDHVILPHSPLPGRIGGFFLSGQSSIFRLKNEWYQVSGDNEILAHLIAIGDQVIRLTKPYGDSL